MSYKILVINPGSTSTKIGVYEDETLLFEETLRHSTEEIAKYATIVDQKDFRKELIVDILAKNSFDIKSLNVVVGRGGLLKPIPGGTYPVSDALLADLKAGVQGQHASNLGGILAREIGDEIGVPSYIVDPVVVDEMEPVARYSGIPELPRISIFHALNQKAVAKRYAKEQSVSYDSLNLVVVHMGGGVSVGAHKNGKVVDVNNTLDGDGPFSPERSGGVPAGALVKMCFSGQYTQAEVYKKINGKGGLNGYLGTNNMRDVAERAFEKGDEEAAGVFHAFTYQVAKEVGAMAAVLNGKVDQILLTGGIAYSDYVTSEIKEKVGFIAPITVYPGEDELLALAQGALRVLNGEEKAKELGVTPMATWIGGELAGCDPAIMGIGPVYSTRKVMKKLGMEIGDFDLIEANEAFAAQSVAVGKDLGFDLSKLNVNGGAIALGHPVGCSGARILVSLLYEMQKEDVHTGLATLCVGGGMGCSAIVEMDN